MEKVIRRILITGASETDPYTGRLDENQDVQYNYGSILSIIDRLKNENKKITDVYLYLTVRIAIREVKTECIQNAIKAVNDSTNIKIYPKDILKTVTEEINIDPSQSDTELEEKIIKKMGLEKVNKFGSFYPNYYAMLEDIKINMAFKDYEKYFNVSSGTSAMESDMNLMAITNLDNDTYIVQVDGPTPNINKRMTTPLKLEWNHQELKNLIESEKNKNKEEGLNRRAKYDTMNKVQMLILKENIESCFAKCDYAGVYDEVNNNKDIFSPKNKDKITKYATHLYYRYIGKETEAKKIAQKDNNIRELYPIASINTTEELNYYSNIVEVFNIMKIKYHRQEINDWLLIGQTVIEAVNKALYSKEIGLNFEDVLTDKNIDLNKFTKLNQDYHFNKYGQKFLNYFEKNNNKKPTSSDIAYHLIQCLKNDNKKTLSSKIALLDCIREARNEAAHDLKIVDENLLNKYFIKNIYDKNYNKFIVRNLNNLEFIKECHIEFAPNGNIHTVNTTTKLLESLIKYIKPDISLDLIDDQLKIYETIQKKIMDLIEEEIFDLI